MIDTEMMDEILAGHWSEHPEFPVADWQYEVANGDTRQGYKEWIASKREERNDHEGL